jgi:hypothetical protein
MGVWRISNHATLDGAGGLRASARWHTKGRRILYCATSPAGALLEILVHHELRLADLPATYRLIRIQYPDNLISFCGACIPARLLEKPIAGKLRNLIEPASILQSELAQESTIPKSREKTP